MSETRTKLDALGAVIDALGNQADQLRKERERDDFFLETGRKLAALEQEADLLRARCAELEDQLAALRAERCPEHS